MTEHIGQTAALCNQRLHTYCVSNVENGRIFYLNVLAGFFTARCDIARFTVVRCLSVCLSVTRVYYVETIELISKQLALRQIDNVSLYTFVAWHWSLMSFLYNARGLSATAELVLFYRPKASIDMHWFRLGLCLLRYILGDLTAFYREIISNLKLCLVSQTVLYFIVRMQMARTSVRYVM